MTADSQKQSFQLKIQFNGDKPFQIEFESVADQQLFNERQEASKIRAGMFAYLNRLRELTREHIPTGPRDYVPLHFRSFSRVLINVCSDGIVIRYDPQTLQQQDEIFIINTKHAIGQVMPNLSLGFIRVTGGEMSEASEENSMPPPPTLGLSVADASGNILRQAIEPTACRLHFHIEPKNSDVSSTRPEFS